VLALDRQTQDGRQSRRAGRAAGQYAKAFRITLDLVKQQRWRAIDLDVEFTDCTQFKPGVGTRNVLQFAQ
jgi:hypothetical protein